MRITVGVVSVVWVLFTLVLTCVDSSTTVQDVGTTEAMTTEDTADYSVTTEDDNVTLAYTMTAPTEDSATTEATLNVTDSYKEYWVKTVIAVPMDENVETASWRRTMEGRLASLYNEAMRIRDVVARSNWNSYNSKRRRKRYVTYENATVQMTNISRPAVEVGDRPSVDLLYYLVENYDGASEGNYSITPAADTVFLMNQFDEQEVAMKLGYYVINKGEVYDPPPEPSNTKYWIIGAVLGGIVVLVLIIWLILFIYLKCTRPQHAGRSRKVADSRTSLVSGDKKTQGFDVIRTDAAVMENGQEVRAENASSMNSAPPPGQAQGPPRGSRGGQPPRGSRGGASPGYPVHSHGPSLNEQQTLQQRSHSQRGQPPTRGHPANRGQPSPHPSHRGPVQRPQEEPLYAKVHSHSRGDIFDYGDYHENEEPIRSTVHRLPPLVQQPLVSDVTPAEVRMEREEVRESLRQKADIERWRNKQRLRERKKRKKAAKQAAAAAQGEKQAYQKAQEEIEAVLGEPSEVPEVFINKPQKRKHKPRSSSHDVAGADPEQMEMKDMFGPTDPDGRYRPIPTQQHNGGPKLGDLLTDSDDESVTDARQRMHELLDEAFSLAQRKSSVGDVSRPTVASSSAWQVNQQQPPPEPGPRHTPLHITPQSHSRQPAVNAWSPYTAGDQAARIDPIPPRRSAADSSTAPPPPVTVANLPKTAIPQAPARHQPPPSVDDYTSIVMDTRMLAPKSSAQAFQPYQKSDQSQPPKKSYDTEEQSRARSQSELSSSSFRPVTTADMLQHKPSYSNAEDEDDVIARAVRPGSSPQPLVNSIREELQRLAERAQQSSMEMT